MIDDRVKGVDTGLQHCIAVSECGRDVFAWGKAARGQLGNIGSDKVSFGIPQVVRGISGIVSGVSAGLNHSAAVTVDGAVYLWGKGMSDMLDLENKNGNTLFSELL
jgi:alpha-tubulin suppressor-like RCC1 family protein